MPTELDVNETRPIATGNEEVCSVGVNWEIWDTVCLVDVWNRESGLKT